MILAAITTCRRDPAMVERAVKSVIAQTYKDWELVVVDDSPSDYELREDVRKMVEGYAAQDSRIRYVAHDKNYGISRARNTALKIAEKTCGSGGYEFIAYLDDDDEWLPEKLEQQIARFNECDENTALVYCGCYIVDENGNVSIADIDKETNDTPAYMYTRLLKGNFIMSVFPLIRTRCLCAIGGFDENLFAFEDHDTWLRLSRQYTFASVNAPLAVYHDHGGTHLNKNYINRYDADLLITHKHMDSLETLETDKKLRWKHMQMIIASCIYCRDYKGFLKTFYRQSRLQPMKIPLSICGMIKFIVIRPLMYQLYRHFPNVFYALRKVKKYKLKGDNAQ